MPITYAGQPLLIGDPNHEFQAWLDRTLSLRDVRLFGELYPAHADNRDNPRGDQLAFVGLPTPNWHQHPPRLKINSLWWPTGASRWAVGLFLATGTTLAKIQAGLNSDGGATLLLKEEFADNSKRTPRTVSPTMYLLTPRKVNNRDDGDSRELLYLLPLVDKRYFWQHKDAGDLSVSCFTAWSSLIASLASALGESIEVSSVSGGYAAPDPVEFTRRYENAAMLLDAAAWCVGHRIVVGWDGTLRSLSATDSGVIHQGNVNGWSPGLAEGYGVGSFQEPDGYHVLAGGGEADYLAQFRPASVRVVFPRYKDYHDGLGFRVQPDGNVWAVTVTAGGLGYSDSVSGRVKTFFDTAYADFTDDPPFPNNIALLQALTNQIAGDFYAHGAGVWDVSCHGIRLWYPSGLDDWVWFHFGSQPEGDGGEKEREGANTPADGLGNYECFTRIASLPYNCEVVEQLHQFCPPDESESSPSSPSEPSPSEPSPVEPSEPGLDTYIDVVICDPWNRCGNYIVFPQRRMTFTGGLLTAITALPNTVVPIYECQSSGGDSDDLSLGESEGTDTCLWCLNVSGAISPETAAGNYYPLFYRINGRCVWRKTGTDWYIVWGGTRWYVGNADTMEYWSKEGGGPQGDYGVGPNVEGVATVGVCDYPSESSA